MRGGAAGRAHSGGWRGGEGESAVDEAMLTGESMPVDKRAGDAVFAGTINRSGSFRYEATKVGRGTVLQQMIEMVKQAQGSRAPVARLADVVSGYFTVGGAGWRRWSPSARGCSSRPSEPPW